MPKRSAIPQETIQAIRTALDRGDSRRQIALSTGVSVGSVNRIVDRTRKADEFRGVTSVIAPIRRPPLPGGWTLDAIRGARDEQMRGQFMRSVRLAESMRTDDVLFTAYLNRIAPSSAVATRLVAAPGERGGIVQRKASASCHVSRGTISGLHGALANFGIAIGYVLHETDDEGTVVDMRVTEWPLEYVRYNTSTEHLETVTREGPIVPIVHGDGRWIVFKKFDVMPWTQDAAILPGALLWAAHAYGISDWAAASKSHGQAKIVGTLPEGTSVQSNAAGQMTPEAEGFLQTLQQIVSGEAGAGLAPCGADVKFLANGSSAWQVFSELALNREKGAARVYTGTDASLGSQGGAPGVDISQLFGVATTRIQGDFEALEQGLNTGLYQPWTAINVGDSRLAPRFEFQLPDPDADQKSTQRAAARTRLTDTIFAMKSNGLTVDQKVVDTLALEFGVSPAPQLAPPKVAAPVEPTGGPPSPKA